MKKSIGIIAFFAAIKLCIQSIGNQNYGFHRDELLHLSASEHLDWGFMEFPPMIAFIGKLSGLFFDYSLSGTRLFSSIAGVLMLILCCLMAKEFFNKTKSVLLAAVCFMSFVAFYRNHTLFQPVAFDQLFWTFGFYTLLRYLKEEKPNYLLYTGAILGLGLLTKYTIFVWAWGIFIGLIFHKRASLFKCKWIYLSGLTAFIIFLPNLLWQFERDFPFFQHLARLNETQLDQIQPFTFILEQFESPATFTFSLLGILFLIMNPMYRPLGIASVTIFLTMWFMNAKTYYVFALYPVLFAAGAAQIATWLDDKKPIWVFSLTSIMLLAAFPYVPYATPILKIDNYISYLNIEPNNEGRYELTGDYADMFGWEEQVQAVDSLYKSLSKEEQNKCVIWAENYGEAGAIQILGKKYGLPNPISRHGSFWTWGYGNTDASVWISLGNEKDAVEHIFEDVSLVKMIYHTHAIGEENGIPLHLCRSPKKDIAIWWKNYEPYIFN